MSELKRKYNGLKQAHKELSVEVIGLRSAIKQARKYTGAEVNEVVDAATAYLHRPGAHMNMCMCSEETMQECENKDTANAYAHKLDDALTKLEGAKK